MVAWFPKCDPAGGWIFVDGIMLGGVISFLCSCSSNLFSRGNSVMMFRHLFWHPRRWYCFLTTLWGATIYLCVTLWDWLWVHDVFVSSLGGFYFGDVSFYRNISASCLNSIMVFLLLNSIWSSCAFLLRTCMSSFVTNIFLLYTIMWYFNFLWEEYYAWCCTI